MKGHFPTEKEIARNKQNLKNSDSKGILEIFDSDERRKHGKTLVARQIELENMKVRQFKAKEKVNEKNISLR